MNELCCQPTFLFGKQKLVLPLISASLCIPESKFGTLITYEVFCHVRVANKKLSAEPGNEADIWPDGSAISGGLTLQGKVKKIK